jgi:hypothetical protein
MELGKTIKALTAKLPKKAAVEGAIIGPDSVRVKMPGVAPVYGSAAARKAAMSQAEGELNAQNKGTRKK